MFVRFPHQPLSRDRLVSLARGRGQEPFERSIDVTISRLRKLIESHHELSATEISDTILREVDWFAQSAALSDDRTLVVLKVR